MQLIGFKGFGVIWFVGIVERFPDSWALMRWLFGTALPSPCVAPAHKNKHSGDGVSEPTEAELRMVTQANALDARLYAHGLRRFEEQLGIAKAHPGWRAAACLDHQVE